jgi:rubrerythrin
MDQEFRDALEKARKLEIDGAEFYTQLAEKCSLAAGKQLFMSFAADERRHLKVVKDLAEGLGATIDDMPMPRETIRTLFADAKEKMEDATAASAEEREAVGIALGMEKQSFALYDQAARDADDDAARKLMERLAQEENQHYEMLENTLEYLEGTKEWFLWTEHDLIQGDQSSIGIE